MKLTPLLALVLGLGLLPVVVHGANRPLRHGRKLRMSMSTSSTMSSRSKSDTRSMAMAKSTPMSGMSTSGSSSSSSRSKSSSKSGNGGNGGRRTIICTDITITYSVPNNAPQRPTTAEQTALRALTVQFFNDVMTAGFPNFMEQDVVEFSGAPIGREVNRRWQTTFSATQTFRARRTTDEVVRVIEGADYEAFILNGVTQLGPYFATVERLDLVVAATVGQCPAPEPEPQAELSITKTAAELPEGACGNGDRDRLEIQSEVFPVEVVFCYVVENTGAAPVFNLRLVDDNGVVPCPQVTLQAGGRMTCQDRAFVPEGTTVCTVTVTGNSRVPGAAPLTANDDATVIAQPPTPPEIVPIDGTILLRLPRARRRTRGRNLQTAEPTVAQINEVRERVLEEFRGVLRNEFPATFRELNPVPFAVRRAVISPAPETNSFYPLEISVQLMFASDAPRQDELNAIFADERNYPDNLFLPADFFQGAEFAKYFDCRRNSGDSMGVMGVVTTVIVNVLLTLDPAKDLPNRPTDDQIRGLRDHVRDGVLQNRFDDALLTEVVDDTRSVRFSNLDGTNRNQFPLAFYVRIVFISCDEVLPDDEFAKNEVNGIFAGADYPDILKDLETTGNDDPFQFLLLNDEDEEPTYTGGEACLVGEPVIAEFRVTGTITLPLMDQEQDLENPTPAQIEEVRNHIEKAHKALFGSSFIIFNTRVDETRFDGDNFVLSFAGEMEIISCEARTQDEVSGVLNDAIYPDILADFVPTPSDDAANPNVFEFLVRADCTGENTRCATGEVQVGPPADGARLVGRDGELDDLNDTGPTTPSPLTGGPSTLASGSPTAIPSDQPSIPPSNRPSSPTTTVESGKPSALPSSDQPSSGPSGDPSAPPSTLPSDSPSDIPSDEPTPPPTSPPPTDDPETQIQSQETAEPTTLPTQLETPTSLTPTQPTNDLTANPTEPSDAPTMGPTGPPTDQPIDLPTQMPTSLPSTQSTNGPTENPIAEPSDVPTMGPTGPPTVQSTNKATGEPTSLPTAGPTTEPSDAPTMGPTGPPTVQSTNEPTPEPTSFPTPEPTAEPTSNPTVEPTKTPTRGPTDPPTSQPTQEPTYLILF